MNELPPVKKSWFSKGAGFLLLFILLLFLCGLIFLGASILNKDGGERKVLSTAAPLVPLRAGSGMDVSQGVQLFGAPLTVLKDAQAQVSVLNITDGETVGHRITLDYGNGRVLDAVIPEIFAQSIRPDGFSIEGEVQLTVLDLQAVYASSGTGYCMMYETGNTVFVFRAENCTLDDFLTLAGRLVWLEES